MGTNKRHKRQARKRDLSTGEIAFFNDDLDGLLRELSRDSDWGAQWFWLEAIGPDTQALWLANRAQILDDWVRRSPGTRPRTWWRFDSPGAPHRYRHPEVGKPQAAYLRDHGLLTASEARQLFDDDYLKSPPIPPELALSVPRRRDEMAMLEAWRQFREQLNGPNPRVGLPGLLCPSIPEYVKFSLGILPPGFAWMFPGCQGAGRPETPERAGAIAAP